MTCEEFEMAALDLGGLSEDSATSQAAREHLRQCAYCAALQASWESLRTDLHALGAETREMEAPARVEMRLRQEFRNVHRTRSTRRFAWISTWALAGAAAVIAAITWFNHRVIPVNGGDPAGNVAVTASNASATGQSGKPSPGGPELGEVLMASNGSGDFTLLPGAMPGNLDDSAVVRVSMQRGSLSSLGLTVNEEHSSDWIQVDVLVGDDGQPQAVRLANDAK